MLGEVTIPPIKPPRVISTLPTLDKISEGPSAAVSDDEGEDGAQKSVSMPALTTGILNENGSALEK